MIEKEKGQMMKIKFTKTESEIVLHRLAVPDAIADAIEDRTNQPRDIIEWEAGILSQIIKGDLPGQLEWEELSVTEQNILIDAAEGSTFFADMDDAVACRALSQGKALAYHRAADSLEKKLSAASGLTVRIPRW